MVDPRLDKAARERAWRLGGPLSPALGTDRKPRLSRVQPSLASGSQTHPVAPVSLGAGAGPTRVAGLPGRRTTSIFSLACLFYLFVFLAPVQEISEALPCPSEALLTLSHEEYHTLQHTHVHAHSHANTHMWMRAHIHTDQHAQVPSCPPPPFPAPQGPVAPTHTALLYIKHPYSWSGFEN